ncbi:SDR family oxidoreductase [Mycolicibacterium mucogenicum]|uniref:LysR family transcriptional regulator n=1 Tax=Mycolicibacterium mucogenicum DSM 44124 TaxID=1226753 RepID=A0A8H2JIH1_MYCMU|nr:NAD(P)H-binding protein [Mycolicibacterium mucogenicum]KAB7753020.1 LysR family transcriptional regulator [Mycolicibacterium mucogenicum DSM 44124]QPG67357.1 NAD(P)H-binding protein [Mycolicibacterium mucogenicum DSM 44124]
MKITVMGASGQIGSKVVALLNEAGHQTVAASRDSGADVLTGAGLTEALAGSDALVDVVNSPDFADGPVLDFFTRSATNLVAAARAAGVGHYVALSIVGCDRLPDSGYMRAKVAQERIITASGLPYTIVRATQFHEFAEAITASLTVDGQVRVPEGLIQPIAGADVAAEVARVAQAAPVDGIVNIGGPDKLTFAGLAKLALAHRHESLPIVVDPAAVYFGTKVGDTGLVTSGDAIISDLHLADWLATQ